MDIKTDKIESIEPVKETKNYFVDTLGSAGSLGVLIGLGVAIYKKKKTTTTLLYCITGGILATTAMSIYKSKKATTNGNQLK